MKARSPWTSPVTAVLCGAAVLMCVSSGAQPTEDQAVKDWNDLQATYETMEQSLENVVPSYVANILGTDDTETLAAIKKFKQGLKPRIEKQLEDFRSTYGDTAEKIDATYKDVVTFDWQSGKHPRKMPGQIYEDIVNWAANLDEACSNKSARLVQEAAVLQERMSEYANQATQENVDKLKEMLTNALGYDPENAAAQEMLDKADKEFASMRDAIEEEIDEAAWPGNFKNFAGPGDPDALAAAALKWLNNDEASRDQEDPDHTFAVCIRGDWVPAEKNILGQPVQWGLPIYGACYNSQEKADGVCRVFGLTILTQEGGPSQKKEPPFTGVWVGNIYKMRIANVKGGRAGGAGGGVTSVSGAPLWLGLILANLVAGLLAAAPLLKKVVPPLGKMYAGLDPVTPELGFIVLIVGLVGLLANIVMRFAPLADLLPQLAAIVTGFVLGRGLVVQIMSGAKVKAPVERGAAQASALDALRVPLGIACLVLAVLHIVMGGVILF